MNDSTEVVMKSGINFAGMDKSVRPQDDLFCHANGEWLKHTLIPEEYPSWGNILMLRDNSEKQQHELLQSIVSGNDASEDVQRLARIYRSFMDEEKVDSLGVMPVQNLMAQIEKIDSYSAYFELMGKFSRLGINTCLQFFVMPDYSDPDRHMLYINQGGLTLPDREYYLSGGERYQKNRDALVVYAAKLVVCAGRKKYSFHQGQFVLECETELAGKHWSAAEARDLSKTYNVFTLNELQVLSPTIDWSALFNGLSIQEIERVVVRQPDYVEGMDSVLRKKQETMDTFAANMERMVTTNEFPDDYSPEQIEEIKQQYTDPKKREEMEQSLKEHAFIHHKNLLRHQLLHWAAPYLSQGFVDVQFKHFHQPISGVNKQQPRWKRGVRLVNSLMGEGLGRLYAEKHFPAEASERMDDMIRHLTQAYDASIRELTWLSDEAKDTALEKLRRIRNKIGHPQKWRDYDGLVVDDKDLLGNVERAAEFEFDYRLKKLQQTVDHDEWMMTPQTVNAYYDPSKNEIVFPAGFLQPPLFDYEADDAANYGAIGCVIGHELSHGFDDQGRKFGPDGTLREWWSDEDIKRFEALTSQLVAQYNHYSPSEGLSVNGELTLGENIADLTGVTLAYRAYQNSLQGNASPIIDGLNGEQRFFLSWAQAWRWKHREEAMTAMVNSDPHSPPEFRVNGVVTNMNEFYDAFNLENKDKLFKQEEERLKIW